MEPVKLEIGMQLLDALKKELGFDASRTSLDFLLSMCVKARDSTTAMVVWKEYEEAGLHYNVVTKLRFISYLFTYVTWLLFLSEFLLFVNSKAPLQNQWGLSNWIKKHSVWFIEACKSIPVDSKI
jgi:hypothetical protein